MGADAQPPAAAPAALATARNIFGISFDGTANVDGDATNTGHYASIPSTGAAGHFVTKNGTAPTLIAGRSAWYSDGSGVPSFKNGIGTAATLVRSSDIGVSVQAYDADLTTWAGITPGAGVGTFLATPSGANLASALTSALPVSKGGTGLTAGTSGGILSFTATGTIASSALLAANALMIGGGAGVAPSTTTTGAGVLVANINRPVFATTVTAAGTTTLTVTSASTQEFTGSSVHNLKMPAVATLVLGWAVTIHNLSTGLVTVQAGDNSTIIVVGCNQRITISTNSIATNTNASWSVDDFNFVTGNACYVPTGSSYNIVSGEDSYANIASTHNSISGKLCYATTSSYNSISGRDCYANNSYYNNISGNACYVTTNSSYNIVSGYACYADGSGYNNISGNACYANSSSYNIVSGYACYASNGGNFNSINGYSCYATTSGYNSISGNSCYANASDYNSISGHTCAANNGSERNNISGSSCYADGSDENIIGGNSCFVSGNSFRNIICGSGSSITSNSAYCAAFGRRVQISALSGVFAFADSEDADFTPTVADSFNIRAAGGFRLAKGGFFASVQSLTTSGGAGAVDIVTLTTEVTTTGVLDALSLADGVAGQIKTIIHVAGAFTSVLTPTTPLGFATITFLAGLGQSCTLQYTASGWVVLSVGGLTPPVVA